MVLSDMILDKQALIYSIEKFKKTVMNKSITPKDRFIGHSRR